MELTKEVRDVFVQQAREQDNPTADFNIGD